MSGSSDGDRTAPSGGRLRVLVLFDSTFPCTGGGRETGIYHIAKYGHDRLDVRLVTYRPAKGAGDARYSDAEQYCQIHPTSSFQSLASFRGYNKLAATADHLLFPYKARRKARRICTDWRPQIVMSLHASPLALAACRLARRWGAKSVINMRSFYSRELSEAGGPLRYFLPYLRRAEHKAVRRVDLVLANGEDTFSWCESCRGLDKKTVLVHNGVDTALFSPGQGDEMRRRHGWTDSVVFMSNNPMRRIKGPQDAIAALARMPEDLRTRCRVVFFSKSEAMFRGFRQLAESLGVAGQVDTLEHVKHEDLPAYLNAADVALHPVLFSAGTTHASLETLACGLPQVSYDAASLRSTCIDGVTGTLVERGNVDALASAMEAMARDERRRRTMGQAAREKALAFDWQCYIDKYVAALQDVANDR